MKLRNYLSSHLAFDCKYVGDITIVAFRPELGICPRIDQLSTDADPGTGALHAPCQQMRHAERFGNVAQITLCTDLVLQKGLRAG